MNYQKIYNAIIEKAKLREEIEEYYEKHHIIPKSLDGSDDKENLVRLTYREHYLCHRLLTKIYPEEKKLHYAFWMMSNMAKNRGLVISSRQYSDAKESILFCKKGTTLSDETKRKISESRKLNDNTHWIGREHSEESKKKMSKSAKIRSISKEMELTKNEKISKAHKGKSKSEEHKKHISEAKQGKKNPMYGKKGKSHPKSKVVYQYTKEGDFVKSWDNARIASEKLGISYAGIRNCVTGKTKTSGKFVWKNKKNYE